MALWSDQNPQCRRIRGVPAVRLNCTNATSRMFHVKRAVRALGRALCKKGLGPPQEPMFP
jgi:hypothetical protein